MLVVPVLSTVDGQNPAPVGKLHGYIHPGCCQFPSTVPRAVNFEVNLPSEHPSTKHYYSNVDPG